MDQFTNLVSRAVMDDPSSLEKRQIGYNNYGYNRCYGNNW